MNKAYDKVVWVNAPSTSSPLNQTNLNKMSDALDTVDDRVIALDSGKVGSVTVTNTLATGTTLATITVDGTATTIKGSDITVDDEMSTTSENPVQNKVIYAELQNLLPEETVAGNPISISDASGLSAKSCEVTFSPFQDLHGQSAPYPAGGGKNKLENGVQSNTVGTLTVTRNEDTSLTINGTTNSSTIIIGNISTGLYGAGSAQNDGKKHIPNGNYIISTGFSQSTGIQLQVYGTNDSSGVSDIHSIGSASTSNNLNIDDTYSYNYVRIYLGAGTYNNVRLYPMIRLSTESDPTFAPYSNICPISGRDSLSLTRTGKNIFNNPLTTGSTNGVTFTVNSDKTVTLTNTATSEALRIASFILKAGSYIYTSDVTETFQTYDSYIAIRESGSVIARGISGYGNFTLTNDTELNYAIRVRNGVNTNGVTFKPMIRLSTDTDATFQQYSGQTHTATFPDTVYGGKYDFVSGNAILTMSLIDLGTLNWSYSNNVGHERFNSTSISTLAKLPATASDVGNIICSRYKAVSNGDNFSHIGGFSIALGQVGNGNIFVYDSNYTDATTFKTAMSGVQLVFELATPTEITLTAEQIELLKGQNVLWTDGDNIALTYNCDIKAYIDSKLAELS